MTDVPRVPHSLGFELLSNPLISPGAYRYYHALAYFAGTEWRPTPRFGSIQTAYWTGNDPSEKVLARWQRELAGEGYIRIDEDGTVVLLDRRRMPRRHRNGFTLLDYDLAQDDRLSLTATGIMAYLLSLADDQAIRISDLFDKSPDSPAATRSGIAELAEHGYIEIGDNETIALLGRGGQE